MRFSNLHTHTVFSDGKDTVRACIVSAREHGMISLGISDHSYTPFDPRYCMRPATRFECYEKTVREEARVAREEDGFPVFLGVEYDSHSEDRFDGYDYRIGSVHYIVRGDRFFSVDSGLAIQQACVAEFFHGNRLDFAKAFFEETVRHASEDRVDIVGHFDLLTKYGLFDGENPAYQEIALTALRETVKAVPFFEVNAGAIIRGLRKEPYPAPFLLRALARLGGRVLLASDAHTADTLCACFPEMLSLLAACGFSEVWHFTGSGFAPEKINPGILPDKK